jgi:chaperonin GroEL
MKTSDIKIIGETFQEIADMVTPTMGAKGRMAIINDEFGRPIVTDDGVTVAKECLNFEGIKRMVAISMIEAANNTEKTAFDGTTLTVLLTNELYKAGLGLIEKGWHPQNAADFIAEQIEGIRKVLVDHKMDLTEKNVRDLAIITTKIPQIGELVEQAYVASKKTMNVMVEHDRQSKESSVEYTSGMIIDSGYMTESLRQLCNDGDATEFKGAHIAILAENIFTQKDISGFFKSIPQDKLGDPFVFIVSNSFNPESLKIMLDTLVANKMKFQMLFINDTRQDELFADIAAYTNGVKQDAVTGTSGYLFKDAGIANRIRIEERKTYIQNSTVNETKVSERIIAYKKELKDNQYNTGMSRLAVLTQRLSNLESGITKIKIAVPTITEYITIKLKLDDALGAVKQAITQGVVIGGGKLLYNIRDNFPELRSVLSKPMQTIIGNAGLELDEKEIVNAKLGLDVKSKKIVDLVQAGIIDSFASIDQSLKNAGSIASNYLRAYILIKKD